MTIDYKLYSVGAENLDYYSSQKDETIKWFVRLAEPNEVIDLEEVLKMLIHHVDGDKILNISIVRNKARSNRIQFIVVHRTSIDNISTMLINLESVFPSLKLDR
jgi:F0F1-type ATP synthase gamma subunit